ncbi:efflux RND transporter permease subunit [Povalibacter sp.]|uniref:efflux RND transporter permease subunit n=1 Tax=Povalibacter sp. TaxID=1962978 RepID=UPI002F41DC09
MSRFFIDRPIFAIVIAILIMLAGGLSITQLPIEQYPNIAPPSVQIATAYPGASAETVQDTVVQVIEQQMSGLDHLLYLSSQCDDSGQSTTTLTFAPGTDPDIAQVQVQNKLQLAVPRLPAQVQQSGLRVTKSSTSYLLLAAFISSDPKMTKFDIADYIASNVQDPLGRLDGVGNINLFGTPYAMRIWLDANQLNNFSLTPRDVTAAIQTQNVQISGGQLGGTPSPLAQRLTATITEATLLRTPEQFGRILLKVEQDGSQVRLHDVARIERGPENFNIDNKYNGQPAAAIGIQLASGANALETADAVRARIADLSAYFPPGLSVVYPYDTTPFVRISIREVVMTLFQGVVLVFLVMYLFLQNFRATLIPTITVPVVLLGTFGVMAAAGFTINTLTMFGLVLAIGLLVDDAIVVVENVERLMSEEKLSAAEAARQAMSQITGALVGVAVVLSAVFVPVAFSSGSVGGIYRQFALTIVSAMALSVFVALSLTPALCALILRPGSGQPKRGFFGWFNRGFDATRQRYVGGVQHVIAHSGRGLLLYVGIIGAVAFMLWRLPTSFLPEEDQGYMLVQVQGPPGGTQALTGITLDEVSSYLLKEESRMVDAVFEINGYNFAGRGQNQGQMFVHFRDWSVRKAPDLSVQALMKRVAARYASYRTATIIPINPPSIPALGTASGFDMQLEDRGGVGHDALMRARDQLIASARGDATLALVRANGLDDNPTYKIDVDREKASAFGVSPADVDQSFSIAWGSVYVNNFLDTDGRIKKVYVQADEQFRMNPDDLRAHYIRNSAGEMVALATLATGKWTYGSPELQRYNGVPSIEIQGQAAPGRSTGDAITAMGRLAAQLPAGIGFEWTGLSLQEKLAGSQAPFLYAISILVVFLSLAALYESWFIPVAVIMVVPLGVLGAVVAALTRGMENDVFFQVGLLTTIGLAAKNAILIVEFARNLNFAGRDLVTAAVESAQLRMRPIVMTSMAFILGVLPLAIATGAGSASRNAIGTGVIGGMISATFIATFFIPMFFVVVGRRLGAGHRPESKPAGELLGAGATAR